MSRNGRGRRTCRSALVRHRQLAFLHELKANKTGPRADDEARSEPNGWAVIPRPGPDGADAALRRLDDTRHVCGRQHRLFAEAAADHADRRLDLGVLGLQARLRRDTRFERTRLIASELTEG